MKATILTREELLSEDIALFWEQGVYMDGWDYIVLAPVETLIDHQYDSYWIQTEYIFERCLAGGSCCYHEWYKAYFRGTEYAVGVAYHI